MVGVIWGDKGILSFSQLLSSSRTLSVLIHFLLPCQISAATTSICITMDKATLLTASKVELSVSAHPRSDVIRLLGPALEIALQFQSLVSSVSVFLCLRAWLLTSITFAGALYASRIVVLKACAAIKYSAPRVFNMSNKAVVGVWNSRSVQRLRKKLWYEFTVFVLGSGNMVFLMLFWPGWWLLAGVYWAVWMLFG